MSSDRNQIPTKRQVCNSVDIPDFAEQEELFLKENPYEKIYVRWHDYLDVKPTEKIYIYHGILPLTIKNKINIADLINTGKLSDVCTVLEKELIPMRCDTWLKCIDNQYRFKIMKGILVLTALVILSAATALLYKITKKYCHLLIKKLKKYIINRNKTNQTIG